MTQKGLDSYQEEDLSLLRDRWSEALARRKEYLKEQIEKLINKQGLLSRPSAFCKISVFKGCLNINRQFFSHFQDMHK